MNHTPGPWEWSEGPSKSAPGAEAAVWGPDGDAVAMIYGNLALDGSAAADARLIAAAPDLLEVLKSQKHQPQEGDSEDFCMYCTDSWPCNAARLIAKVEGREEK